MALLPKKTYSRRNKDLSVLSDKEKENVDPFDELLSSPLKQEVQFQPLSFWGQKVRHLESKKLSEKPDCGLFKSSDSDQANSPCQRKRKSKSKKPESKARTLQPKNRSHTLIDRRKNFSARYFTVNKAKAHKSIISNKNETVLSTKEIGKYEGWSLNINVYPNESVEATYNLSPKNSVTSLYSVRSERNYQEKLHFYQDNKSFTINDLRFKIYEDFSTSDHKAHESVISNKNETVVSAKKIGKYEDWSPSSTIYPNESMETAINLTHQNSDTHTFDYTNLNGDFSKVGYATPFYSVGSERNYQEKLHVDQDNKNFKVSNVRCKMFEDISTSEQKYDEDLIFNSKEDSGNGTIDSEKSVDETLIPFQLRRDSFKFVTVRRHFNYPHCNNTFGWSSSDSLKTKSRSPVQVWNESNKNDYSANLESQDVSLPLEVDDKTLLYKSSENAVDGVVLESSSDGSLSSFMDEKTVIEKLKPETNDSPFTDFGIKKDVTHSVSNGVSVLTTSMSELSIKNATDCGSPESEIDKTGNVLQDSNVEDKEKGTLSVGLRNVTTRRRGIVNKRFERKFYSRAPLVTTRESQKEKEIDIEMEGDQSLWLPGRASLDWNKSISFVNPVFESTRVFDMDSPDRKRQTNRFAKNESILGETLSGCDRTYILKPGKKWLRSRSVLKQVQNGTILESTRITGRKFESFVQEMIELQNEKSGLFTSLADVSVSNKTVLCGIGKSNSYLPHSTANKTVLGRESLFEKLSDTVFSKDLPNEIVFEKSSLGHTVKVIQEEEKASAFRTALGLDNSHLSEEDSVHEESSEISARDFILMQCGQEDVLPFEEYFNERTLDNCRKIGEGVYGEVFMCSDSVLKIIPIEGADKVNGEPQKTFAEIISEVVIASKLSNLRNGKKHRTDGFSEMKRCWCVKGKYPKYLLHLWEDYDQKGSGSENDSPVMFKDDQLYIILELANGGKDLEAFVFSSSAQTLSLFIQIAFSLAVAEKAFQFEHRDLHWGNVLISETKEKFMTVYLDGFEYTIPTKGVKVCIIDFTLSRINHEGCCIFNDLSADPSLFTSEGDYQFEIYRMMLNEVKNDWSLFRPRTNIFWLHYTLDKMLKMVRYKNKKAKIHIRHLKDLKTLENGILDHEDSTDFVLCDSLIEVMNKL